MNLLRPSGIDRPSSIMGGWRWLLLATLLGPAFTGCQKEETVCSVHPYVLAGQEGPNMRVVQLDPEMTIAMDSSQTGWKIHYFDYDGMCWGQEAWFTTSVRKGNDTANDFIVQFDVIGQVMTHPYGSRFAYPYSLNDTIGPHASWDETNGNWSTNLVNLHDETHQGPGTAPYLQSWRRFGTRYLGLRTQNEDGDYLYGWVEAELDRFTLTLKSYGVSETNCPN